MAKRQNDTSLRDVLECLAGELVAKGILWQEAFSEFEKLFILRALQLSGGSIGKAANRMGVHRNTLARKIREYGIDRKSMA